MTWVRQHPPTEKVTLTVDDRPEQLDQLEFKSKSMVERLPIDDDIARQIRSCLDWRDRDRAEQQRRPDEG